MSHPLPLIELQIFMSDFDNSSMTILVADDEESDYKPSEDSQAHATSQKGLERRRPAMAAAREENGEVVPGPLESLTDRSLAWDHQKLSIRQAFTSCICWT